MDATETCRICHSPRVTRAGSVEYLAGYARTVYDCGACGCRFTLHDDDVYDRLHLSGAISYYQEYRELGMRAKALFDARDVAGLRELLLREKKYRFVIDEVERARSDARILEVGCARGSLTAYFLLTGRTIFGTDVSETAIESARQAFGEHFGLPDSGKVEANAPYDIIYHVGMIGCVADPVVVTRQLLRLLKPDGKLIFNSPNLRACRLPNQLWFDSAPPPDLVTLFPPGFWTQQFERDATVSETVDFVGQERSFVLNFRKRFGPAWVPPTPRSMKPELSVKSWRTRASRRSAAWLNRVVAAAGRITGLAKRVRPEPTEFGLFVKLEPK